MQLAFQLPPYLTKNLKMTIYPPRRKIQKTVGQRHFLQFSTTVHKYLYTYWKTLQNSTARLFQTLPPWKSHVHLSASCKTGNVRRKCVLARHWSTACYFGNLEKERGCRYWMEHWLAARRIVSCVAPPLQCVFANLPLVMFVLLCEDTTV